MTKKLLQYLLAIPSVTLVVVAIWFSSAPQVIAASELNQFGGVTCECTTCKDRFDLPLDCTTRAGCSGTMRGVDFTASPYLGGVEKNHCGGPSYCQEMYGWFCYACA